jgi:hypothetical protein
MQAIIELLTALQFKIQEIATNFFFSISTIPKPLIPGVSIKRQRQVIHFCKVVVCCPCLLASEIVLFLNAKKAPWHLPMLISNS